jgi:uncharacterized cofD-like protein
MLTDIEEKLIQFARNPRIGPRITVTGGGTGLSTLLRGLKLYTHNLTAIVTVADNGGSSGMLREDMGMLTPGDIRNCILALADTDPLLSDLFHYRFSEGRLSGQSFGNLFIAAMNSVCGNFYEAIVNVSKVLAVKGRVLPVSLQNINISAQLSDGSIIVGESEIGNRADPGAAQIIDIFMDPADANPMPEAVDAIMKADLLVLGPGSLYTSIIPNLLFPEICEAVEKSKAPTVYVGNIMTQPAETLNYDTYGHVEAILRHMRRTCRRTNPIDYCVVNNAWIDEELIERYHLQSAIQVTTDQEGIEDLGIKLIEAPLACVHDGKIRHDHTVLARTVISLLSNHDKGHRNG